MSDANVLDALDRQDNGYKRPSLNNIIIYGRVRCIINKPSILGDGIKETNGYFAIIDAYALKCLGEDYFREGSTYDINSIYFTKGSILVYIDSPNWVGKDVKVFGKSKYYGVNIRRQNCPSKEEGISAFMFGPPIKDGRKSIFPLVPNVLVELNAGDKDAKGTVLEDFIVTVASKKDGDIPYPETLDSIIPYTGVANYSEFTPDTSTGITKSTKNPSFVNDGKRIDISKIDMKLVYHLEGQERSKYFEDFKEDIELNANSRKAFVSDTISEVEELFTAIDYSELKDNFILKIASNPHKTLGGYSTIKCKKYIELFIENCYSSSLDSKDNSKSTEEQTVKIQTGVDKLKKLVMIDSSVLYGNSDDSDIDEIPMLNNDFTFIVNVIGTCTGIGFSALVNNLNYCRRLVGITDPLWLFMLLNYPYVLGLIGVGLSVVDCDILYYSFSKYYQADEGINLKYRSYLLMLDTLNNCSKGIYKKYDRNRGINTFIKTRDYKNADCCYPEKAIKNLDRCGFVSNPDIQDLLQMLLGTDVVITDKNNFTNKWFSQKLFDELCEAGIINTLDDYCALERNIEQEFMIYEVFEKLGKMETGIDDATISEVINDFESERGFKLESLQKEGIKLCKYQAGVLSGCAGSGKTTTSDCMTEVLKTLGDDVKIIYCTPTGKACRRLAEVVHSTVKTIHSQFSVHIGSSSYLQDAYKKKKPDDVKSNEKIIYILDEMAMCSTELMYHIAKNISDRDLIYFLGDVKQLPPIGGGCPFKVLMSVLPCVELGVSKRAAEGSLVNYNTSLINFMSDNYCKELLYDDKTFIAKDCPDANIAGVVRSVFAGFIDGTTNGTKYSEDDIQVITGYQKKERLSSTSRLNKPLQELLRKNDEVLYYREVRENGAENEPYYKNDRVIYVNKNSYDICRYVYENGVFNQVATFGCVNGEMGKLVGIIRSTDIKIHSFNKDEAEAGEGYYSNVSEEEFDMILDRYKDKKDDLRKDSSFCQESHYFVVIKVYDTDLRRDVYALLRGRGRFVDSDFCLSGSDLDNLNLAYALTCHKMQGSQSPVVIMALESTGSPDFLNRNMLNTIITRSQGIVCCVGSVLGSESMLNRGRLKVSKTDSRDILSVMSGTADWI